MENQATSAALSIAGPSGAAARLRQGWTMVSLLILAIYLGNSLLPNINLEAERWQSPDLLPYIHPVGTDFREGYFYPAKVLLQGKSPYVDYNLIYPPFSALFSTPFRLFPVEQAYLLQVVLLYVLNAAVLWLALQLAEKVLTAQYPSGAPSLAALLFVPLAFLTITSYGFIFSVERGNFDIYTVFFSLLGLWLAVSRPRSVWLPVILISLAAHLKIYPAILFLLLVWKDGKKSLLPLAGVNLVLLFSTGPVNVVEFLKTIVQYTQNPFIWVGNHSAASFASYANHFLQTRLGVELPLFFFYLIPVLLWMYGAYVLWRGGFTPLNALLLFILSIPLMNLIPSVSHDYKLVLLHAPLAVLLLFLLLRYSRSGRPVYILAAAGLLFLFFFLTRTPYLLPAVLANKYPFILLFQGLILLVIIFSSRISAGKEPLSAAQG